MYKIYVLYYFQVALVKVLREFTFLESDKNPAKLQLGMSQYRVLGLNFSNCVGNCLNFVLCFSSKAEYAEQKKETMKSE
jgi:hypothetical protein